MKRGVWNYIWMAVAMVLFMIGTLDSFDVYKIPFLQGVVNMPSLLLIIGGSFFQAYAAFPASTVWSGVKELTPTFTAQSSKAQEETLIEDVMELVRGLKSNKNATIERIMSGPNKGFRVYLAELLSTNYSLEDIRILGSHKIHTMRQAETGPLRVVNGLGASSPAYGMMGTLMGLIVMLGNFDSAAGLASGLAVALMTTFYGLILAQFIWQPLGKKLLAKMMHDQMRREVELEAVVLAMMGKPELYIVDQLSSMVQARDGSSSNDK